MSPIWLIKAHKLGKVKKFQLTKIIYFLSLELKTYYFRLHKIKSSLHEMWCIISKDDVEMCGNMWKYVEIQIFIVFIQWTFLLN